MTFQEHYQPGPRDSVSSPVPNSIPSDSVKHRVASTLKMKKSRYPKRKGYTSLREKRGADEKYASFFASVEKVEDGIIIGKKKISLLAPSPNRKEIIGGDHRGQWTTHMTNGSDQGCIWYTYVSGKSSTALTQNGRKKLIPTQSEIIKFLQPFPGSTIEEKIFSLVSFLELPFTGYYDPGSRLWENVGLTGYIMMTPIHFGANNVMYGVRRDDKHAKITSVNPRSLWITLVQQDIE